MTKMPENNKERNQRFKTMFKYGAFAGIGCITAPFVASFGLSLMGFKSAGIAAGSLAATLQVSSFTKLFFKKMRTFYHNFSRQKEFNRFFVMHFHNGIFVNQHSFRIVTLATASVLQSGTRLFSRKQLCPQGSLDSLHWRYLGS